VSFYKFREVNMKLIGAYGEQRICIMVVVCLALLGQFADAQRNHQRRYGGEFNVQVHNETAYHIDLTAP
jgi:hypothetical protein